MKTVQEKYEEYLKLSDKTKEIDNIVYYKAVYIDFLKVQNKRIGCIVLPYSIFEGRKGPFLIINDAGTVFEFKGIEHIRFIDGVPEWYLKCGTFIIDVE